LCPFFQEVHVSELLPDEDVIGVQTRHTGAAFLGNVVDEDYEQ
jgi:hypothetical protein